MGSTLDVAIALVTAKKYCTSLTEIPSLQWDINWSGMIHGSIVTEWVV